MIVCDTGVLVAAIDADDAHHAECAAVFADHGDELVVCPRHVDVFTLIP